MVSNSKRGSALPDVPTTLESGLPNSDYEFWIGAFAAAGTPAAILQRLHDELRSAVNTPTVRERLKGIGGDPMQLSRSEFEALVRKDIEMNAALVKAAGIRAN